jgi:glycosyltransferase involved in cell wall biosynthesis
MISNFGRSDGGRETWAYNFIPRLLAARPSMRLRIYGLRRSGWPDNSVLLRECGPGGKVDVTFVETTRKRLPALSYLTQAGRGFGESNERQPDLVLAVGSALELAAAILSPRHRKVPKIVWLRNILLDEKSYRVPQLIRPLARRVERALLRRANLILANGWDTAQHYEQLGLRTIVIPNGVDVAKWDVGPPSLRGKLRVAYIGRLNREKGAPEFLSVASELGQSDKFEFHVVGGGSTEQAEELARKERLIFHGPLSNDKLPGMISQFDICVALTHKSAEHGGGGVSNALLEQMAASRVIVAWDNQIFRQLLDERSAYLVPQGDVAALTAVLNAIAAEPSEARSRALAARKTVEDFSFESHMKVFLEAAESILNTTG